MFGNAMLGGLPTEGSFNYPGSHKIRLIESSTNAISIPALNVAGVDSKLMKWDDATNKFTSSENLTRISEFIKQLNKRYTGSSVINNAIVIRCKAIDADSLDTLVFTPGATVVGSTQDFGVIITDQEGGYESRGFTMELQNNANGNELIDGGNIVLRLSNMNLPW